MGDEAETGFAGEAEAGGHPSGSLGQPAPLQTRANFLQNWSWVSVTQINLGLCQRGRAQHGLNSQAHAQVAEEWEKARQSELTLLEIFRFLRGCHRAAPFLF